MSFGRTWRWFFVGWTCIVWLAVASAARADVRQARNPIFNHKAAGLLADVQARGTDLPLSLRSPRDIYVFVTAGGAYTDVMALALPSVPAATLAQALDAADAGTALSGQTVTWSSDDYSAAHVSVSHGRLFQMRSTNTVALGPLLAGLRRAGYRPHCLFRIPVYALATGLPPPCLPPTHYRWYDEAQAATIGTVTVRATLPAADAAFPLFFLIFPLLIGVCGLSTVSRIVRDTRLSIAQRRSRCLAWTLGPLFAGVFVFCPATVLYFPSLRALAMEDLWWGRSSASVLLPFIMLGIFTPFIIAPISTRLQRKHLGSPTDPVQTNMSPEEKAVRQRMARWTLAPHLLVGMAAFGGLWFLPHKGFYNAVPHAANLLVLPIAALVALAFKKPLAAFTRVTVDDDLTWRARQLATQLGVRVQDVKVEDSAAASAYAFITTERGGHLKVSRKLTELLTPEEMDYVLASEIARMNGKSRGLNTPLLLTFIPSLIPLAVVAWMLTGHAGLAFFSLMPYLMAGMVLLMLVPLLVSAKVTPRIAAKRAREAHEAAIRVTQNAPAAASALMKMIQNTPPMPTPTAQAQSRLMEQVVALRAAETSGTTKQGYADSPRR